MCNQIYNLFDWETMECPVCGKIAWQLKQYRSGIESILAIKCLECGTEYCPECGETLNVEEMREAGYIPVSEISLRDMLNIIKTKRELEAKIDEFDFPSWLFVHLGTKAGKTDRKILETLRDILGRTYISIEDIPKLRAEAAKKLNMLQTKYSADKWL